MGDIVGYIVRDLGGDNDFSGGALTIYNKKTAGGSLFIVL